MTKEIKTIPEIQEMILEPSQRKKVYFDNGFILDIENEGTVQCRLDLVTNKLVLTSEVDFKVYGEE